MAREQDWYRSTSFFLMVLISSHHSALLGQIGHSRWRDLAHLCLKGKVGGEGGIRTHGRVAPTHAFQACRFVHSRTSPRLWHAKEGAS